MLRSGHSASDQHLPFGRVACSSGRGGLLTDRLAVLRGFSAAQWIAGAWLGIGGGALAFIIWVLALQRASPTRVASTIAVNPMAAALLVSVLVGEPITVNLILGLVAAFAGIWTVAGTKAHASLLVRVGHPSDPPTT